MQSPTKQKTPPAPSLNQPHNNANKSTNQSNPTLKGVKTGVLAPSPGVLLPPALLPPPPEYNFSLLSVLTTKPPLSKAEIPNPLAAAAEGKALSK
jgi:hypothetical protein